MIKILPQLSNEFLEKEIEWIKEKTIEALNNGDFDTSQHYANIEELLREN